MNKKKEIYVSIDVETDGPIPGPNSMLSIGAAAYDRNKTLISTFSQNLELLEGATPDPSTMEWWKTQPDAWKKTRENLVDPGVAMKQFVDWLSRLDGNVVLVAYPAGFDFTYVYWYVTKFCGKAPFSFSCIDIKTFAMVLLNVPYKKATKRNFPSRWFDKLPHTHVAVDDAIEQGAMFINMLKEVK